MPESVLKSEGAAASEPACAPATPITLTVLEALAAIWDDSRAAPATYLDSAVVPYGGE